MSNPFNFSKEVAIEFAMFMLNRVQAEGAYRRVYDYSKEYVVKYEVDAGEFNNVREWDIWKWAQERHPEMAKWLAPCHSISQSGNFLLMARTKPLDRPLPTMLPDFLHDCDSKNFGIYDGRIVCHDYGFTRREGRSWSGKLHYRRRMLMRHHEVPYKGDS